MDRDEYMGQLRDYARDNDMVEGELTALENTVIYGVQTRRTWAMLDHAGGRVHDTVDDLRDFIGWIDVNAPADISSEDRREVSAIRGRAEALMLRCREAAMEITRLMGEVGNWHDSRPLATKRRPPGAHALYR